jgi:hypothetical protein
MVALHRGRLECAKALLRAGADPNYMNGAGDLTLFWAIDGGVECIKLLAECAMSLCAQCTLLKQNPSRPLYTKAPCQDEACTAESDATDEHLH